ncbi:unnamed protein product [Brassica rapa]|uniref:Pectinesterase inhibitor domain-containing protein n=3 Tax=Brassica campestris TaxID=3711 RepID=A0A3P6B6S4_BRACM|nr:unnamed protein product [Brassica rapa]VDC96203.1 unnamed protein product [Brassica rapa]
MVCFYSSYAYITINIVAFLLLSRWSSATPKSMISSQILMKGTTCPFPSLLISKACKGTASISSQEQECIESLTFNRHTASASTVFELAKVSLSLAMEKAERTMILIGSPKKPCFKSCAENYKDSVAEGLKKAEWSMEKGDLDETDDELSLARDAADYCHMVLSVDPDDARSPIFSANRDVYNHITYAMSVADLL